MNNEVMEIKINEHTEELKEHDRRLDKIEQDSREFKVQIQNLCKDLQGLTVTIRWFMGLMVGSFVGFFFYAIQHGLFK